MTHPSVLETTRNLPWLSLQEMSLIKIMTVLCNNQQLLELIFKSYISTNTFTKLCPWQGKNWKAVKTLARKMVSQICNSHLLKKKILELLWPVSFRILFWKSTYAPFLSDEFLQQFYWTHRGKIDDTRTIRCIIRNQNISVRERFILACSVCLNEELHEIWSEMSQEDKNSFFAASDERTSSLHLFWAHTLDGSDHAVVSRYSNEAIDCAVDLGYLDAVKYLFTVYLEEDRSGVVLAYMIALNDKLLDDDFLEENDIGYFLFSKMTKEDQKTAFNSCTILVLTLLLLSSEYELYLNLLVERLDDIKEEDFTIIFRLLFYTYHYEVMNDDACRQLFIDVYRAVPSIVKSFITDTHLVLELLPVLIRDNFSFLLRKDGSKKISKYTSLQFQSSTDDRRFDFHQGKWKFLHFIIEEMVSLPLLETQKYDIMEMFNVKGSNLEAAWQRLLIFLRKIKSQSSRQNT